MARWGATSTPARAGGTGARTAVTARAAMASRSRRKKGRDFGAEAVWNAITDVESRSRAWIASGGAGGLPAAEPQGNIVGPRRKGSPRHLFHRAGGVSDMSREADKPTILVTRRLTRAAEERAQRDYRTRLNAEDRAYDAETLAGLAEGAAGVLAAASDRLPAAVIAALPETVRIIATFSVGTDHIDIAAAKTR